MRLPLLEYLDKLEATAMTSSVGPSHGRWEVQTMEYSALAEIYADDDSAPVADLMRKVDADHIVATQPKATLALISKLREAHALVIEAAEIARRNTREWRGSVELPSEVLNRFQDDAIAWANIEVPE